MVLLKKKLDENRQKFEQREKEMTESQRGVEQTVNSLKKQLEERDLIINELKNPTKPSKMDENGDAVWSNFSLNNRHCCVGSDIINLLALALAP